MPIVEAKCTNCGAALQVDNTKDAAVCPYCQTPFIIEKAINNYNISNNITAGTVNIIGGNSADFEIRAGTLLKYNGAATDVVIPNSVTSIDKEAFKGCTGLTSITIPDSVTRIGDSTFDDNTGLTSVKVSAGNPIYHSSGNCLIETASKTLIRGCNASVIPSNGSVTSIGGSAFYGCTGLTSITIPDSVTSIGNYAFSSCTGLTNVTIPDSVTSIGSSAFYGCTGLASIKIPDTVTSIGGSAFYNVPNIVYHGSASGSPWSARTLNGYVDEFMVYETAERKKLTACSSAAEETITIPDSVTSIGYRAFNNCTGLTSVTIPDSVTSIGSSAFYGCTGLTSVTIGNGITSIDGSTFRDCPLEHVKMGSGLTSIPSALIHTDSLKSFIIGNGVTSIDKSAFKDCIGLTSVTVPESMTNIGESAFSGCTGLTSITIPYSVTRIGENAFSNIPVVRYNGKATGAPWGAKHIIENTDELIGSLVLDQSKRKLIACLPSATKQIDIPSSVDTVSDLAFLDCTGVTAIYLPVNVTRIGVDAFKNCGVKEVYYEGAVIDKLGISIAEGNTALTDATWHYNSPAPDTPEPTIFTLTYNANGGRGAPEAQTGNGVVTIPDTRPTCDGYTFVGWATSATATSAQYLPGGSFNLTENMTLYAVWQKNGSSTDPTQPDPSKPPAAINGFVPTKDVDYKASVTFSVDLSNAPTGATAHWFVDGKDVGTGETYTVPQATKDYTVQVKLFGADGTELYASDVETVHVNTSFFAKLIAFFRSLFGALPKITQAIKDTL